MRREFQAASKRFINFCNNYFRNKNTLGDVSMQSPRQDQVPLHYSTNKILWKTNKIATTTLSLHFHYKYDMKGLNVDHFKIYLRAWHRFLLIEISYHTNCSIDMNQMWFATLSLNYVGIAYEPNNNNTLFKYNANLILAFRFPFKIYCSGVNKNTKTKLSTSGAPDLSQFWSKNNRYIYIFP